MKIRKENLSLVLAIVMVVVMISSGVGNRTVEAASVRLNKTSITLTVGKSKQLQVKGTKKKVLWSVSNEKIVKVTKNGKVKARKAGNAKVYAKVAGKKLTCKVKVKKVKKQEETIASTASPEATADNTNTVVSNSPMSIRMYMSMPVAGSVVTQSVYLNVENYTANIIYIEPDAYLTTQGKNYKVRIANSKSQTYETNGNNSTVQPGICQIVYDAYDYVMSESVVEHSQFQLPQDLESTMTLCVRINGQRYKTTINYAQQEVMLTAVGEEVNVFSDIIFSDTNSSIPVVPSQSSTTPMETAYPTPTDVSQETGASSEIFELVTEEFSFSKEQTKKVSKGGVNYTFLQLSGNIIVIAENTNATSVSVEARMEFLDAEEIIQDNQNISLLDILPGKTAYYTEQCVDNFATILVTDLEVGQGYGTMDEYEECFSDIRISPMSGSGDTVTITESYVGSMNDVNGKSIVVEAALLFYDKDNALLSVEKFDGYLYEFQLYEQEQIFSCQGADRYEVIIAGAFY